MSNHDIELTPEVLDSIEKRARGYGMMATPDGKPWPTVLVERDTVLALVAAARERDDLRGALTNARATASDAIASRDKITADIMAERDELRALRGEDQ